MGVPIFLRGKKIALFTVSVDAHLVVLSSMNAYCADLFFRSLSSRSLNLHRRTQKQRRMKTISMKQFHGFYIELSGMLIIIRIFSPLAIYYVFSDAPFSIFRIYQTEPYREYIYILLGSFKNSLFKRDIEVTNIYLVTMRRK